MESVGKSHALPAKIVLWIGKAGLIEFSSISKMLSKVLAIGIP